MKKYEMIKIEKHKELIDETAEWFCQKWAIPKGLYIESMQLSLKKDIPKWYVVLNKGKIIAGLGVIENDFHKRKDLTPNVCAVYVEKEYRCQGIAGKMLQFVCHEFSLKGIDTLYLMTDHISFYERYGWQFLDIVEDNHGQTARMYVHKMEKKDENKSIFKRM